MCVAPVLGFSPFGETTDMLTLRNPRFQDRHPYRAWFRENKHLITAHLLWALAVLCVQTLAGTVEHFPI